MTIKEIADVLKAHDNYEILTHNYPDGDCLGSGFALCIALQQLGKNARVITTELPQRFGYLTREVREQDFDAQFIISVDVADEKLLGINRSAYEGRIDLCIDHHGSNCVNAPARYVEAEAAAAGEIIFALAKELGVNITKGIADCLYTAVSTDTGCFKYENTTPKTHIIAAELMAYDIDFANVNRLMFDVKSRGRLEVEQTVISQMKYYYEGRCSMIVLTKQLMAECGVDQSEFDGLASIPL